MSQGKGSHKGPKERHFATTGQHQQNVQQPWLESDPVQSKQDKAGPYSAAALAEKVARRALCVHAVCKGRV
jgi:hypothetical protein